MCDEQEMEKGAVRQGRAFLTIIARSQSSRHAFLLHAAPTSTWQSPRVDGMEADVSGLCCWLATIGRCSGCKMSVLKLAGSQ